MVQAEDLAHHAQVLVGLDELLPLGVEGGDARGKLPAVLDVQQHLGDQPAGVLGPLFGGQPADLAAGEMIDRGDAALVVQLAHARSAWG